MAKKYRVNTKKKKEIMQLERAESKVLSLLGSFASPQSKQSPSSKIDSPND